MSNQVTLSFKLPTIISKVLNVNYLRQVAIEIVQTALVAGIGAGLTALANQVPSISAHYGLSPLITAQLIAVIGTARAFVSGVNSAKNTAIEQQFAGLNSDVTGLKTSAALETSATTFKPR